jgi:Flp pilus assembly protein TadG
VEAAVASIIAKFIRRSDGNVAPMFAIAAIPLIVAMGAVVDYTNAYDQKTSVQDAMDAAALAAGKKIGLLTQTQLVSDVNAYYHSNVDNEIPNAPILQVGVDASTITLTTDLAVPTYFLGLINLHSINFHITSQATLALGTLEIAMVLDNSGSFTTNNNIVTERTAATNLATTLWGLAATSTKPNPVQIALVPFAGEVNVGPTFQTDGTATWLDKTGIGTYNADIMDGTATTVNPFTLLAGMKDSTGKQVTWGGCVEARPIPYDATDDAAVSTTPSMMFVPAFAPDEPDNWTASGTSNSAGVTAVNSSTGSSSVRYNQAPSGSQSYNNYLPDVPPPVLTGAGATGTTVTMTKASPAVFTTTANHGLSVGDQVVFSTTGALYTGITAGTVYYVKTVPTSKTFTLVTSYGGSTTVNTSCSQSGVEKITTSAQWTCRSGSAACNGTGNGVAETTAMSQTAKYGTRQTK